MTVEWYDKTTDKPLTSTQLNQTFCVLSATDVSPYIKVSGGINLNTQYGDPNTQAYPDTLLALATPQRGFPVNIDPQLCSAMPDPLSLTAGAPALASEWDSNLGFLQQDSGNNFPTTGSSGLYFDLIVAGTAADELTWSVTPLSTSNVTATVAAHPSKATVTLAGPVADQEASDDAKADAFIGPASFNIQAKDKNNTVIVDYPFTIKKWFVRRSTYAGILAQIQWCTVLSGSNYAFVGVRDLTNSNYGPTAPSGFPLPLSSEDAYSRRIGAGLSTEWGWLAHYSGTGFALGYVTKDIQTTTGYYYSTNVNNGDVTAVPRATHPMSNYAGLCVSQ